MKIEIMVSLSIWLAHQTVNLTSSERVGSTPTGTTVIPSSATGQSLWLRTKFSESSNLSEGTCWKVGTDGEVHAFAKRRSEKSDKEFESLTFRFSVIDRRRNGCEGVG